jgi:hypothetical protein
MNAAIPTTATAKITYPATASPCATLFHALPTP